MLIIQAVEDTPDREASPEATWAGHCARGDLAFQRTPDGVAIFPPRLAAPGTGAPLRWEVSAGRGAVYATTVLHERGGDPRNLAIVELDEGFRMVSRVEGIAPNAVAIGLRVECFFDGQLPLFRPAE